MWLKNAKTLVINAELKIRYSEKAKKFEKIFHLTFDATE